MNSSPRNCTGLISNLRHDSQDGLSLDELRTFKVNLKLDLLSDACREDQFALVDQELQKALQAYQDANVPRAIYGKIDGELSEEAYVYLSSQYNYAGNPYFELHNRVQRWCRGPDAPDGFPVWKSLTVGGIVSQGISALLWNLEARVPGSNQFLLICWLATLLAGGVMMFGGIVQHHATGKQFTSQMPLVNREFFLLGGDFLFTSGFWLFARSFSPVNPSDSLPLKIVSLSCLYLGVAVMERTWSDPHRTGGTRKTEECQTS